MNNIGLQPFSGPSRVLEGRRSYASTSRLENLLIRRNSLINLRLEEVIDIDKNLSLFSNEQLNLLNPRRLYDQGILSFSTSIFRHRRIEALHLLDGREEKLNLMSEELAKQLLDRKHNYIHLGLIVFRPKD